MKFFWLIGSVFLALSAGATEIAPQLTNVGLDKIYVPVGFDSNDYPQVYVQGRLKDTCHQVGPHEAKVDVAAMRITVTQKAYVYAGPNCWPVAIPYEHAVNLPILAKEGDYDVVDGQTGTSFGNLVISAPQAGGPGTDDFIYAPVDEVQLTGDVVQGLRVILTGNFPNDCMRIQTVRLLFQQSVVVVLPIVEMVKPASGVCSAGQFPFFESRPLNRLLGQHTHLFHVRSMAGQAVNRLLEPYSRRRNPVTP